MCERAAELGHSLLFPAVCRYCGEQIYLFATPLGGFAIFDDVGGDWPKHECWGIEQSSVRYSDTAPTFSKTYRFPVPEATPLVTPPAGARLIGTIIAQDPSTTSRLWPSALYDGTSIYKISTEHGSLLGRCVRGTVEHRANTPVLLKIEILAPTILSTAAPALEAVTHTEAKSIHPLILWDLQAQAQTLKKSSPRSGGALSAALDALLNGQTLAGMLLLTRLLGQHTEQIATSLKATAVRVILLAIRDLKLYAAFPSILSRLSGGTLSALDQDTRRLLDEVRSLGQLHRHYVAPDRIRRTFERRLNKERQYLERTQGDSSIGPDFDALWQS
jgi:hypothetical protein